MDTQKSSRIINQKQKYTIIPNKTKTKKNLVFFFNNLSLAITSFQQNWQHYITQSNRTQIENKTPNKLQTINNHIQK